MAITLAPYLHFRGEARAAMEFYRDVFGGELTIATFRDAGAEVDSAEADLVMHGDLRVPDGMHFMGSDVPERMAMTPGSNFTMSLNGDTVTEPELRRIFDRLAEGGEVTAPLEPSAWGAIFGMCNDRFGIGWMVNITPAAR